jgi:hypothetical protein
MKVFHQEKAGQTAQAEQKLAALYFGKPYPLEVSSSFPGGGDT